MKAKTTAVVLLGVVLSIMAGLIYPALQYKSNRPIKTAGSKERRIMPPSSKWSILQVAVSPDGARIAVLFTKQRRDDWARIYSTDSGKIIGTLKGRQVDESLYGLAWNPSKPILAVLGGHEPQPLPGQGAAPEAFFFVNARSGKLIRKLSSGLDSWPSAWMPDGRTIIAHGYPLDTQTGSIPDEPIPGLSSLEGIQGNLNVAPDWTIAAERQPVLEPDVTQIEVYRKLPGKELRYTLLATLQPDKNKQTGKIISFRTQPAFLKTGRLAYARVFLTRNDKRERVELWTSHPDGRDERKWISLPLIPAVEPPLGGGDGKYRLTPISWSRDGKVLAYVLNGQIYVKKVKPPGSF